MMKENKSPGVDEITPKLLKGIVNEINIPLATLFNIFHLKRELFQQNGRRQMLHMFIIIVYAYLKTERLYINELKTSVLCKLLETFIRDQMVDFLVNNKLITKSQHGFLKAKSCLTNLLCF